MSLSSHFEIKATLYFRVHDAEIYGGLGSVGYASNSFILLPGAKLDRYNDEVAESVRASCANMLEVPIDKVEYITAEEYRNESEDDNGGAFDIPDFGRLVLSAP